MKCLHDLFVQCYRHEEPVRGAQHDLFVRRKFYYKRQGVERFVKELLDSGTFRVCVYSSMMGHNIEAGLNALIPHLARRLTVLDR